MNPILALIITNVIWGAASPIFKLALTNIPPFTLAFIRFFFAGLLFLPFVFLRWQRMSLKEFFQVLLVGFFGVTVNITFFFLGLPKTASTNAPVIASSGPIFIYLFSIIFLREKPKLRVLIGLLIALTGVLLIIFSPIFLQNKQLIIGEIEGNLFFVLATLGSVFQTLVGKEILKKINYYQVVFLSFIFGALTFLPFSFAELDHWSIRMINGNGILGIIFGILFSSAIAYFLFYYGVSKIRAQEVGLFTYIDPIVAIIIAVPLLHEYPSWIFILGSILVLGGIYIAERRIHYHPFYKLKK